MAAILENGLIQFEDGQILYSDTPISGSHFMELQALLPQINPVIGRSAMVGFPFISGGGGGAGTPGAPGAPGPQGVTGVAGGGTGPQGETGLQGVTGPGAGAQGATGVQGVTGQQGQTGIQGQTGPGAQGTTGVAGQTGLQGQTGIQGQTGPGAQGTTGVAGQTGLQGQTGIAGQTGAGATGTQGVTGQQGQTGVQGQTGAGTQGQTGVQGATGIQGQTGPGAQGATGAQGVTGVLAADIFAATRVVSAAGDGTDTTVSAAIAALPAAGGRIYVKQGTYALAVTNTLPDKPVDIIGSGDGTIFDLGANAIAAFTIPNGLTAQRKYSFEHFKVIGTSVASQRVLSVQDTNAFGVPTLRSIKSEAVQVPIEITAGDSAFLTPVFISVYDSWFVPIAAGTGILCNSNGISNLMNVAFYNTKFIVDDFNTIGGTIDGDSFGNLDVAFYDCDLSLTGEDGLSTIHAERSRIFNFSGTPHITFINGNFVSTDYLPTSAFINCNVLGMWLVDAGGLTVLGGWWTNDRIETGVVNGRSEITGVTFRAEGTSAATFPVSGGVTAFIANNTTDLNVANSTFSFTGITLTAYIFGSSDMVITGCAFRALTGASTAGIRVNGVNNFMVNDDFDTVGWGAPPILEVAPADRNVYNDCLGLNGNGGTGSVFVGVRNTFNGLSQLQATAATTDAFVSVTTQVATSGVQGIATIKNTGANGMNVRETGVDQFGTTSTQTTLVAAGNDLRLDPTVNVGTARPPYNSYMIEVQSSLAGNPTTYVLRLGMNGEVTW